MLYTECSECQKEIREDNIYHCSCCGKELCMSCFLNGDSMCEKCYEEEY